MITVEFFGVCRLRAEAAQTTVECDAHGASLGGVLKKLAEKFPAVAKECFQGDALRPGYIANLNGQTFLRHGDAPIPDGSHLLLLSADAGG